MPHRANADEAYQSRSGVRVEIPDENEMKGGIAMKASNVLIKCGLAIYAISIFVNFTVYKIPKTLMIITLCVASISILMGYVFLRIRK